MKKSILSLLALTFSVAYAEEMYAIVLSSGERYMNCTINYRTTSSTKFTGVDQKGKKVSKVVNKADILTMRPIDAPEPEEEIQDEPKPETTAPEAEAPAQEEGKAPAEGEAKDGAQPTPEAEAKPEEAPAAEPKKGDEKAKDATLRLREKLAQIDTEMAKLTKPSRSLVSQTNSVKSRITRQLEDMDRQAIEIAKLQEEFNQAGAADFTFDKVSIDNRMAYLRDGQAAYKAMLIDMKQKKGRRKVGGLDKFEIMRDRYQGIPEYKEAHARFLRTLRELDKKWKAMHTRETNARKRYPAARAKSMRELDERQYDELRDKLAEDGDDIATVWIIPAPRNLKMLNYCVRKVEDVLRRSEKEKLDKAVGTVPSLIEQYWECMDQVRTQMINGDLEGAEKTLHANHAYNTIMRLNKELLPLEYKDPIREQYKDTESEITKRRRNYDQIKRRLETATGRLDRNIANAEAQIDSAMEAVYRAVDSDIGENTMKVDQPEPAPAAKPEEGQKPAEAPQEAK